MEIPFNRPHTVGTEFGYISDAIERGQLSGNGAYAGQCTDLLARMTGSTRVLLTPSCTAALEMMALLTEVGPGDEVILPSFTFVTSANAFALRGATPVFVDIRSDTLNLDERQVEAAITPRTKAIMAVHYAGVGCAMDELGAIADRHDLALLEDAAQGILSTHGDDPRPLGSFGSLGALSFHETKNVHCGEGGALLINDERWIERAEILQEKGTNRSRFFRGQVDKYTWVDVGSSYLMSDVLAAFLYGQLEALETIQAKRRRVWETYDAALRDWCAERRIGTPVVPADREQAYHMYYLVLPSLEYRQALIAHLKAREILAVFHYLPLHLSDMGRKFGGEEGDCPVAEDVSNRLLRLPFYNELSEADQASVIQAVRNFDPAAPEGRR
jgi:dTDP-4-amino-4,6-dideoxygalactose transaminase